MLILGIETSCDETGLALYDAAAGGLLAHAVHSQIDMHEAYGGVVPELASRDHIRRLVPLCRQIFERAGRRIADIGAIAYTEGPGLAGALLTGAAFAQASQKRCPFPPSASTTWRATCCRRCSPPAPAISVRGAARVRRPHPIDARAAGSRYQLLGERRTTRPGGFRQDAQLLGLAIRAGRAVGACAIGQAGRCKLPRPMMASGDLEFSFSGLKTAVLTLMKKPFGRRRTIWRASSSMRSLKYWWRNARSRWNAPD